MDFDDILDDMETLSPPLPDNGLSVMTLACLTDLVDCCNAPRSRHGEWKYPNGTVIEFDAVGATFRRNRVSLNGGYYMYYGPGDQIVYGAVHLWRRGIPPERGRFRCEIPNAANPTVNQTLYVHICKFKLMLVTSVYVNGLLLSLVNIGVVNINSPSGSNTGTAGTSFSLECSATVEIQADSPTTEFEWFYGTNNGSVLPGATAVATVLGSGNTYTSTLQFSPLQESHTGIYTCRVGRNARLANNITIAVNRVFLSPLLPSRNYLLNILSLHIGPTITVRVIAERAAVLGNKHVLTCDVSGEETLSSTLAYQWTRDNGTTQAPVGTNSRTLTFSVLSLSDAGRYTCGVNVSSPYLNSNIVAASSGATSQTIVFRSEFKDLSTGRFIHCIVLWSLSLSSGAICRCHQ